MDCSPVNVCVVFPFPCITTFLLSRRGTRLLPVNCFFEFFSSLVRWFLPQYKLQQLYIWYFLLASVIALSLSSFPRSYLSSVTEAIKTHPAVWFQKGAPHPMQNMSADFFWDKPGPRTEQVKWSEMKEHEIPMSPYALLLHWPVVLTSLSLLDLRSSGMKVRWQSQGLQTSCETWGVSLSLSLSLCIIKVEELEIWRLSTLQCRLLWISHPFGCNYSCIQTCLQVYRLFCDLASLIAEVITTDVKLVEFWAMICFLTY